MCGAKLVRSDGGLCPGRPGSGIRGRGGMGGAKGILGSGNFLTLLRIPYHVSRVLISIGQYLVAVVRSSAHQCHHRYSDTFILQR